MKIVIAIGGNALVTPGADGNINDQFAHSRRIAQRLAELVQQGWHLTITHGNGPQVGNIMRRVELASNEVYPIDLGLAVADTQAGMGYMIAQTLHNELQSRGVKRSCTAIVTSVVVDPTDPAFDKPTKPIGAFMTEQQAAGHRDRDDWVVTEDSGRGWRRLVPSPRPQEIVQLPVIQALVEAGHLLVACGGGGIPVIRRANGELHGVEAVIDKDLTSALLAAAIAADTLVIVTGVESIYLNYGRPDQRALRTATVAELRSLANEGHFAAGSMLPKVRAVMEFLELRSVPDARAVITDWSDVPAALTGKCGTTVRLE